MTTADVTRLLHQPAKHYAGVRQQQGRVLYDADWNEGQVLDAEERRRFLAEIVGPNGSPDDGFALALEQGDAVPIRDVAFNGADPVACLDYRLVPGSYYVCGVRFEHEPLSDMTAEGDAVVFQRDFLQMQQTAAPLATPESEHSQLTYLHGWEQTVSVVEDEELREVALGGLDTSCRVRRMAEVVTREVADGSSCTEAWLAVRAQIEAETGGVFDESGCALLSSARLRLSFVDGATEDSCSPCISDAAGRYLGADNQTVRIMLASAGGYVFGIDNASLMFRVRLGEAEDGFVPVELLTPPRSEAQWPLANTVMEFLGAEAILYNGLHVAQRVGTFLRVARGYDPDTQTFLIDEADAAELQNIVRTWDAAHPESERLPADTDFFARPWHRLDDAADPVLLSTGADPANHALLARLGLQPEFDGTGQPGDYWSVNLRPNTPQQIVPWNMTRTGGVPPHGPQHYFAPLNRIALRPPGPGEPENTEVVVSIEDCRRRFRPLIDRAGCCTHSVGDGVASRGDYSSIQAAIDNLPAGGGKVCILPGVYREEFTISRDDVTVEGCGNLSVVETPGGATPGSALIQVLAQRITIKDLALVGRGQVGILVGSEDANANIAVADIALVNLDGLAEQREAVGGQARSVVDVRAGSRILVRDCELRMDGSLSDEAVAVLGGTDLRILNNRLVTTPSGISDGPWGGLQVRGGTTRVDIFRNRIDGGIGHGITFGSVRWIAENDRSIRTFGAGAGQQDTQDPCRPRFSITQSIEVETVRYDPESAGDLADVRIVDNRIENMSGNGISVLTTLPLADSGDEDLITVDRIQIVRNRIVNNVVQASALTSAAINTKPKKGTGGNEDVFGQFRVSSVQPGGIVLVDGERILIRDNDIRDNGTTDVDPISGISITYGNGIVIEGNRIKNNGLREPNSTSVNTNARAGIMVSLAGIASDTADQDEADVLGSSLRIVRNKVEHPNGVALAARATGPLVVTNNFLLSEGNNASAQQAGIAHAVVLTNVGLPFEAFELPPGEPSPDRWQFPDRTPEFLEKQPGSGSVGGVGAPGEGGGIIGYGGQILFADNHVVLNWAGSGTGTGSGLESGFSVGLCSLDNVIMTGNYLALNVADPGVKKTTAGVFAQRPRVSAHAVIVGGTAAVANNRVSEGVNDALISLLVLGGLLASATNNVTTHLNRVATVNTFQPNSSEPPSDDSPDERQDRGNLVWLRPTAETSSANLVSVATVNATANQLFAALSDACLGLPVEGVTITDFGTFVLTIVTPTDG